MSLIVSGKLKDPRIPAFLTITKVKVSKDLHYAHVFITIQDENIDKEDVIAVLNKSAGFIQHSIAEKVRMRYTPKIEFRYDYEDEKASNVDRLLDKISMQLKNNEEKEEKDS